MKVLELESTITKIKNTMGGSRASRKEGTEKRDSKHEDQTIEFT